jgi:exopolysaccharide biosynthesis polyprenyl glycosylphosphotransferase
LAPLVENRWKDPLRFALVADWEKGSQFIARMEAARSGSFRGLIVPEAGTMKAYDGSVAVLGSTRKLAELINKERLQHVIVLNASLSKAEVEHCSRVSKQMDVPVSWAVDFVGNSIHVDVTTNYGLPFIELTPFRFTRRQEIVKRLFDAVVASLSLVFLLPLLLAIVVVIKATSKGPVLYKSSRVGKGGRRFTFLKFRSMYVNDGRTHLAGVNEKAGHIFKMKNDPRITPVGKILRRYSLDELPQLVNIARGEMSFVGPRPLPAGDLGLDGMSKQYSAWSEARSRVHPGLTGLWQVSGRSDLSFEDMMRLDTTYIQNWSLLLDIRILVDTPMLVLRGAGAY